MNIKCLVFNCVVIVAQVAGTHSLRHQNTIVPLTAIYVSLFKTCMKSCNDNHVPH
jgi:hypothetical protein